MSNYFDDLLLRYQQKGVLIDANLLLLYNIGLYDKTLIKQFKRTMQYETEDYEILMRVIKFFAKTVTMPNILTEVNSLANQLPENRPLAEVIASEIPMQSE